MPSPAELRPYGEASARAIALAVIGVSLWASLRPDAATPQSASITQDAQGIEMSALIREAPPALDLQLEDAPPAWARDMFRALQINGSRIQWASEEVAGMVLGVEPVAGPNGRSRITVVGDGADTVAVMDDAGILDSAARTSADALSIIGPAGGTVTARGRTAVAHLPVPLKAKPKPILVLGRVGWESKFVVAALEEAGWDVRTSLSVTPATLAGESGAVVVRTSGAGNEPLDTASLGVVIALDGSATVYARRLARFVAQGGGVILGVEAIRDVAELNAISAGRTRRERSVPIGALSSRAAREGLSGFSLTPVPDAVPVEFSGGDLMVAARRHGLGRVVTVGYHDVWRWRMEGRDGGVAEHRQWWSELVSSVAPVAVLPQPYTVSGPDPAPLASWKRTFGPPAPPDAAPILRRRWLPWFVAFAALLLIAEWTSRRLRGAR